MSDPAIDAIKRANEMYKECLTIAAAGLLQDERAARYDAMERINRRLGEFRAYLERAWQDGDAACSAGEGV